MHDGNRAQILILAGGKISYISSSHLRMQIPLCLLITLRFELHPHEAANVLVTSVKLEHRDTWWPEVKLDLSIFFFGGIVE